MNAPENASPDSSASRCPRCQVALPSDAPAGLCPACLVSAHFGTEADVTEPAATAPAPTVDEIAPHFPQLEILACLGRGGMGVVYRARQKSLGRLVALKLLAPERGGDPAFAERFAREAQALARLDHPHIVTIHDFGQAGGYFYLLMEYVDGVTLRQLVQGGRIAAREALAIVPQICDALQFAHDHGVVHRDIKPENILLDRKGQVKVADFGLAKLVGPVEDHYYAADGADVGEGLSPDFTAAGHVMGTPRYMAPEQRERPTEVDHRADIYALGVVLYQMLTGELPGERQLDPPSRRVRVDVRLDEIVLRALERDPERRYSSATEFKTRIETFAAEGAPAGAPVVPPLPGAAKGTPDANATQAAEARRAALEKLKPAATALIVSSVLNLAGLLLGLVLGVGMSLLLSAATVAAVGVKNLVSPTLMFLVAPLGVAGALTWLLVFVAVLWLGLHAAANIFIITSARRMMTGRSPRRARTSAIIAVVLGFLGMLTAAGQGAVSFFGLWSLLQLGAGVWALVSLQKSDAHLAFEGSDEPSSASGWADVTSKAEPELDIQDAARQVAAPATGLLVAAGAQTLLLGLSSVVVAARLMEQHSFSIVSIVAPALGLFLISLSLFVLLCAARMRRLRGHGFAVVAAVLSIVTFQGLILGPIFGIWALVVLLRRDVRAAFDRSASGVGAAEALAGAADPSPEASAEAARRLALPSIGLLVSAGLQLLLLGLFLGVVALRLFESRDHLSGLDALAPTVVLALVLLQGAASIAVLFCAARMRRLRGYGLAVSAAVLSIVTFQGLILGPIFGLWALVVLLRRDVSAAFDAGRAGGRGRGCLFAALILLLAVILAAVGVAATFVVVKTRSVANDFGMMPWLEPVVPRPPIAALPTPAVPAAVADDFGAVQTWTLPFGNNDDTALLDLEAARIVLPADEAAAAYEKRLPVAGVYFHHNRATNELKFTGLSVGVLNLDFKGEGAWEGFNSAPLRKSVADMVGTPGTRSITSLTDPDNGTRTHVYLFKTRTGACGVLRTTSLTRDPHEISLEWKFFSDAGPVAKDATAAVEGSLTTEQLEAGQPALAEADAAALRNDLEARMRAINTISQWQTRDEALCALSADAVKAGEVAVARRALASISAWQVRDEATRNAALALKAASRRADALSLAQTISQWQIKDQTVTEISR